MAPRNNRCRSWFVFVRLFVCWLVGSSVVLVIAMVDVVVEVAAVELSRAVLCCVVLFYFWSIHILCRLRHTSPSRVCVSCQNLYYCLIQHN